MKLNVYESIRFHAQAKRRQQAAKPARVMMGMAAVAVVIAASTGILHAHAPKQDAATYSAAERR